MDPLAPLLAARVFFLIVVLACLQALSLRACSMGALDALFGCLACHSMTLQAFRNDKLDDAELVIARDSILVGCIAKSWCYYSGLAKDSSSIQLWSAPSCNEIDADMVHGVLSNFVTLTSMIWGIPMGLVVVAVGFPYAHKPSAVLGNVQFVQRS